MQRVLIGLAILAVAAAACGAADDGADATVPPTTSAPDTTAAPGADPAPEPAPVETSAPGPRREDPEPLPGLASAVAATDLAARLDVEVSDLAVNVVESVTWPDGSIGCPQPGMAYTQALVPGVRVIIEFGGELYHYHGTTPDALFYCENPSSPVPGDPGDA